MPVGVSVTTDVMQPSGSVDTTTSAQFFVAGLTERGDTTAPVVVRNMAEYAALLGGRVTYGSVYDQAQAYFGEGGSRMIVARAVGTSASKGTVTAPDRASGSPVSTLTFTAENAGAWSSGLQLVVSDGLVSNTVNISVVLNGAQVEIYNNLANPAAVATALNASTYVRAADLGSATAAPNNNPAAGTYTLSAGSDDRGTMTATTLVTALAQFGADLGPGMVAIPGQPYSTVAAGIAAHCAANRRVGAVVAAQGTSVSAAITAARSLRTTTGSEGVGFFYPYVTIPDGAGGQRTISPEGYAAGVRARSILAVGGESGPWFGETAKARFVTGAESTLSTSDASSLADGAVNPIRVMLGGVRLYDWRSLSYDESNWRFLNYRDLINEVAWRVSQRMESFVGAIIDGSGHLFSQMEAAAIGILVPYTTAGALYALTDGSGNQIDPGYRVITASPVNTPTTIAAGQANIRVEVRPSPDAELIGITISKAALTNTL
jgi:hypothetical protein